MLKSDFYHKFGEKMKIYLLLAAENFLLAEQLQISAGSSASKLPARADTILNPFFSISGVNHPKFV